jgi:IS5 family transposase
MGYRGHNAPPDYNFKVFISGQKRGVTPQIKRQLRRRSAVEPVIGAPRTEPTHTRATLIDRATY